MSSHENRSQETRGPRGRERIGRLFGIDTGRVESLSWPLGNRVTVEAGADQRFRFDHGRSVRSVTAFAVTDDTAVVRLRTPVGREKSYGLANADIAARPAPDDWIRANRARPQGRSEAPRSI